MARQVKNRLERLDKINEQSLSRKVRLTGACAQGFDITDVRGWPSAHSARHGDMWCNSTF